VMIYTREGSPRLQETDGHSPAPSPEEA
jgi:hypothetical protein